MYGFSTKGIISLINTMLLISLLPAAFMQEDNSSMNSTIPKNTILQNITALNKTNILAAGANKSAVIPAGPSDLHLGKGLNEDTGMSSITKGGIASPIRSISHQSFRPELKLGNPAKPMKDLEKVVFICNIL